MTTPCASRVGGIDIPPRPRARICACPGRGSPTAGRELAGHYQDRVLATAPFGALEDLPIRQRRRKPSAAYFKVLDSQATAERLEATLRTQPAVKITVVGHAHASRAPGTRVLARDWSQRARPTIQNARISRLPAQPSATQASRPSANETPQGGHNR